MQTTILRTIFYAFSGLLALLSSGCAIQRYQVTQLEYVGAHAGEMPNVVEHEDLTLIYNFWDEEGKVEITVQNHLNEMVLIDFNKSVLMHEEKVIAYDRIRSEMEFEYLRTTPNGRPVDVGPIGGGVYVEPVSIAIPAHSRVSFQRVKLSLPVPLSAKASGYQVNDLPSHLSQEGTFFRHILCYRLDDPGSAPRYVEDHFRVVSSKIAGKSALLSRQPNWSRPEALTSYAMVGDAAAVNTAAFWIGFYVALPISIIAMIRMAE